MNCPLKGVTIVISAVNDELTVKGLMLYPNSSGSVAPYLGPLPGRLTRDMKADGVHSKLGRPTASGNGWEAYNDRRPPIFVMYIPPNNPKGGLLSRVDISQPSE
jgi:hypothetical protein